MGGGGGSLSIEINGAGAWVDRGGSNGRRSRITAAGLRHQQDDSGTGSSALNLFNPPSATPGWCDVMVRLLNPPPFTC